MAERARAFPRAIVDIGTGDGRYPLRVATTSPHTFALGIEPSVDGLRDTARALTRRPLPNIALIVASVETSGFEAIADEVTVSFPWGTLLDAVLGSRADVLASVARVAKPGAPVRVLVSAVERDGRSELDLVALGRLRGVYREAGLEITGTRAATRADIDAACSSWGKRLDAGRSRPAFLIGAVRR